MTPEVPNQWVSLENWKQAFDEVASWLKEHGFADEEASAVSTDYENRCGNCHAYLGEQAKYCPYCGTKRGEGAFAPYENSMECIYGPPPIERVHTCSNPECGYTWTTSMMIDDMAYCPRCGSPAPVTEEHDPDADYFLAPGIDPDDDGDGAPD